MIRLLAISVIILAIACIAVIFWGLNESAFYNLLINNVDVSDVVLTSMIVGLLSIGAGGKDLRPY